MGYLKGNKKQLQQSLSDSIAAVSLIVSPGATSNGQPFATNQ
jgi:hypothetical protein